MKAEVQRFLPHKLGGHTHLRAEHFKMWLCKAYPGEIPQELGWTILVLIPKGNTDTWGIDLLETMCKFFESIINTLLRVSI